MIERIAPLDPQNLTFGQKVTALVALGRIPLASETPLWCFFGCLLSSQVFAIDTSDFTNIITTKSSIDTSSFQHFRPWVALQCMLIVWGTNISINYGNEYFDYDMDRPGMVAAIKRDLGARRRFVAKKMEIGEKLQNEGEDVRAEELEEIDTLLDQENGKIMGSTTRIIHDGTFPPYASLLCSVFVQVLLVLLVTLSRRFDNYDTKQLVSTVTPGSPFRGVALYIGLLCTFLSQMYVGPPLRLHYNGFGELVSALLLSPVSVLFGLVGHYTAVSGRPLTLAEFVNAIEIPFSRLSKNGTGFALDTQLIILLVAFYLYEQARILIMHIHDISADRRGGKITMTVRLGFSRATRLYVILNAMAIVLFSILLLLFGSVAVIGTRAHGSLYRIAGRDSDGIAARIRATAWSIGLLTVMAFAIPCMVMTARSLFAKDAASGETKVANKVNEKIPDGNGSQDTGSDELRKRMLKPAGNRNEHDGNGHSVSNTEGLLPSPEHAVGKFWKALPVWPHAELVKIVSLQVLLTPVVLSISLACGIAYV